jgi:hypothetical protein
MPSLTIEEIIKFSSFPTSIFVETGTHNGDTTNIVKDKFERVYTIELSEHYFNKAKKRFESSKNVQVIQGDSSRMINKICEVLDKPTFFWLDGHYSGGDTAQGEKDCPLIEEISSINDNCKVQCVVAIDDVRLFKKKLDQDWSDITVSKITSLVAGRMISLKYFPSVYDPKDRLVIELAAIA